MDSLEQLLKQYEDAIERRDVQEMNRLCMDVEREADRTGYRGHGRIMALHSMAERAMPAQDNQ
jgi:hypothetical protein